MSTNEKSERANVQTPDSNTILVILLLVFCWPIGIILMWVLMKYWPKWLKVILTLPIVLMLVWFGFVAAIFFHIITSQVKMDNHKELQYRNEQTFTSPTPEQVLCTMEAKQCPDGSFVGRQGPKCDFAPCPTVEQSSPSAQTQIPPSQSVLPQ